MVAIYKVREELKCSYPGFDDEGNLDLTEQGRINLDLVTKFLRDLFSLEVKEGEEYLYKITQSLVTDLVDYPKCVAVLYPSVKSSGYHVAIKGPHQHQVRLTSVKMMDSVTVDIKREAVCAQLLRSYDQNLTEDTASS